MNIQKFINKKLVQNFKALSYVLTLSIKNGLISIRPFTTDYAVFKDIFIRNAYKLPFNINFDPVNIIDAGANCGFSALYFYDQYKTSNIIAIEPEYSNFKTILKNIKNKKRITAVNAGIWCEDTTLDIHDRNTGKWGFSTVEAGNNGPIKAFSVDTILKDFSVDEIDIFKIDIEGAEKYLFSKNYANWLNKTKILIIELHDRIYPDCSEIFNNAIKDLDFKTYKKGENIFLIKQEFLA